jgi:hypothetical protein
MLSIISGFEVANLGCCGTGRIELAVTCNKFDPFICGDVSKYVFWDADHLTEREYRSLVSQIIHKHVNKFFCGQYSPC